MVADPNDWRAAQPGMGSCFHQALHRWALLHAADSAHGFRVAIGIVEPNPDDPVRHLHAWLERGDVVMSAVSGVKYLRRAFYRYAYIERGSVRYVNPRRLMRAAKFTIDRRAVVALLDESGHRWQQVNGGVLPVA